jgi:hypothetical protein
VALIDGADKGTDVLLLLRNMMGSDVDKAQLVNEETSESMVVITVERG